MCKRPSLVIRIGLPQMKRARAVALIEGLCAQRLLAPIVGSKPCVDRGSAASKVKVVILYDSGLPGLCSKPPLTRE